MIETLEQELSRRRNHLVGVRQEDYVDDALELLDRRGLISHSRVADVRYALGSALHRLYTAAAQRMRPHEAPSPTNRLAMDALKLLDRRGPLSFSQLIVYISYEHGDANYDFGEDDAELLDAMNLLEEKGIVTLRPERDRFGNDDPDPNQLVYALRKPIDFGRMHTRAREAYRTAKSRLELLLKRRSG